MTYKARKFWSAVVLVVWLPANIVIAVSVMTFIDRPPIWVELVIYAVLGLLWALPFRKLFRGIGKPDPDAPPEER